MEIISTIKYSQYFDENGTPIINTELYTLKEILTMSDEEFFTQFPTSEFIYNDLQTLPTSQTFFDIVTYQCFMGYFSSSAIDTENFDIDYTPNITEMTLNYLLSDTIDYDIKSPLGTEISYDKSQSIYKQPTVRITYNEFFPDNYNYEGYKNKKLTSEENMKIAKLHACVNQVLTAYTETDPDDVAGAILMPEIIPGDINCDKVLDSYDVVWLNKLLTNKFDFIDNQNEISDINGDGKLNVFDKIILTRNIQNQ